MPTILEVSGISAPEQVDGIKQAPIEGTSFAYTFNEKNAKELSRCQLQKYQLTFADISGADRIQPYKTAGLDA